MYIVKYGAQCIIFSYQEYYIELLWCIFMYIHVLFTGKALDSILYNIYSICFSA